MVYFVVTWNLLAIVCLITGSYLLNLLKATCFDRTGDRLIVALWSGLAIIPILLLAVSFIFPLSLLTGLAVAAILLTLSLLSSQTRAELIRLKSAFSINWLLTVLCLELLTVALINRPMEWFDTGGYHIGAIKWLSEAGTVPGVALINYAFGFTSSWFAFAAPLTSFLGNHLGAVTNGFVFLVTAFHLAIALAHVKQRNARLSDLFAIVISLVFISVYIATIFAGSPILISFSPDVPITLLVGIIAWVMLVIKQEGEEFLSSPASPALDVRVLPALLAIGAISFKLSALPVIPIAIIFYWFETRFALKKILISAALLILLALPMIGYGLMTSACPLFPSTVACLNLPWKAPQELANSHLRTTRILKPTESEANSSSSILTQRLSWFKTQRKVQIMLLLYVISIIFSVQFLLSSPKKQNQNGFVWVIGLSILGMSFIIFYAPLIRFGLIYFILIPALFVARYVNSRYNNALDSAVSRFASYRLNKILSRAVALSLTCFFLIILAKDQRYLSLIPPELPEPQLIEDQVNDLKYTYPADGYYRCWAASLPCSGIPLNNIRLRDPEQGIRAGFIYINPGS